MAKQDTFTSDEWTLIRLAPSLISSGVAAADPSGIFSSLKEAMAGARGMAEAFKASSNLELFAALAADHSIPACRIPSRLSARARVSSRCRPSRPPCCSG